VGNIASYDDVNSILAAGRADLCVLARGHLYDLTGRGTPRTSRMGSSVAGPVRLGQELHPAA